MDLRELKFGIEIETIKRTRQTVAQAIRTVVGGTVRHVGTPVCYDPWEVTDAQERVWKVVADSSLTSVPSHLRAEVVTPVLTYSDIPELQKVIRAVRKLAGAEWPSSLATGLRAACLRCRGGQSQGGMRASLQAVSDNIDRLLALQEKVERNSQAIVRLKTVWSFVAARIALVAAARMDWLFTRKCPTCPG